MRALICPAHYLFDDQVEGSEFAWAFHIADGVARDLTRSVVVAGKLRVADEPPYAVVELEPHRPTLQGTLGAALGFNLRYSRYCYRALRSQEFDLLHHLLPFALDTTFDLALVTAPARVARVIGPVQPPLAVLDSDVNREDVRGASSSARVANASAIARLGRVATPLVNLTLRSADAVVAVNDAAAALIVERGVAADCITVVPPGVDTERFTPGTPSADGVLRLLAVCNLVRRKRVDAIVAALRRLRDGGIPCILSIVGNGPERAALESLVTNLGLREYVTFAGAVPHSEVDTWYRNADVFVNASEAEGFATVCLEAIASGLPVVSTRVGGFLEVLSGYGFGKLVSSQEPEVLAAAIRSLVERRDLTTLRAAARAAAIAEFDWRQIVPRYLGVYETARARRLSVAN